MISIDYNSVNYTANISSDFIDDCWMQIYDICIHESKETHKLDANTIEIPWWSYLNIRKSIYFLTKRYNTAMQISESCKALILKANTVANQFNTLTDSENTEELIYERLKSANFTRPLFPFQIRNLKKITMLPAAATFSVPGSGKTTEALAYYSYFKTDDSKLLVVLPKNAFMAWEEQVVNCITTNVSIKRLTGGYDNIKLQLKEPQEIMLITYQQLITVYNLIGDYLSHHDSFIFIDESHRMKRGVDGKSASAILKLSGVASHKLVMSGTPMPQSSTDLIPQFNFLYPEIPVNQSTISSNIKKIYVRTTRHDLVLPQRTTYLKIIEMDSAQEYIYQLLRDENLRAAEKYLKSRDKNNLRALGKSCIKLLQAASNPALLTRSISNDLLNNILLINDSPKINYVCKRARYLAASGKKTLIWTNFVENVEVIANRLQDLNAVYIHGGVPSGSKSDSNTREYKIDKFVNDPEYFVMVANPAAACEGISLHMGCQYAIYLDRTFNAAHYLQSIDRIYRIGLPVDTNVTIEILKTPKTIDEAVEARLLLKVEHMADVLDDNSLREEFQYSDEDTDDEDQYIDESFDFDDGDYLASHIIGGI